MRPRSRPRVLLSLAALVLLGLVCVLLPPFAASPYQMAKARNIPATVPNDEVIEEKSPLNERQAVLVEDDILVMAPRTPALKVRYLLYHWGEWCGCDWKAIERRRQLAAMGEKAFPTYEAILSDPKATKDNVWKVLSILHDVKADRRRFVKYAVARLRDANVSLRNVAVSLMEQIGSVTEAPAVVPLLSDKEYLIVHCAAKTLAAIGSPRELEAMDKWLRGDKPNENPPLRQHVQKCRDELKKRLAETKAPAKK